MFNPLRIVLGIIALFVAWFIPWVWVLKLGFLIYFPYGPDGRSRSPQVMGPFSKNWVENIPKPCKKALTVAEDDGFYDHHGVDFQAMRKAYEHNDKNNKQRGGSTITQQLVKNAFLSRSRSYVRKAREAVGAVLLDAILSKESQLTWYFNVVEFGPNIYGLQDAAQFYYHVDGANLNALQCAGLVAILPSPIKWGASLRSGTSFFTSRRQQILNRVLGVTQAPMPILRDDLRGDWQEDDGDEGSSSPSPIPPSPALSAPSDMVEPGTPSSP